MTERERQIVRARAAKSINALLARRDDELGRVRVVDDQANPPRKIATALGNDNGRKRVA